LSSGVRWFANSFSACSPRVGAVDEEQHASRPAELDEPVQCRDGEHGLAASRGHLDERARPVVGERPLEVEERLDLATRPAGQPCRQRVSFEPLRHRLGTMKAEDRTAPRPWIEEVHEPGLRAVAQVEER
jgi:hypothetical protein